MTKILTDCPVQVTKSKITLKKKCTMFKKKKKKAKSETKHTFIIGLHSNSK